MPEEVLEGFPFPDEARLSSLQDFYQAQGIIQQKSNVKDLYTNQFIQ